MYFGLTAREWSMFGIGSAVQGALMGAMFHSLFFLVVNMFCLGINIYLFQNSGSEE